MTTPDFWRGKRVLVTGSAGFKGAWLCNRLIGLGATVFGLDIKFGQDVRDIGDVAAALLRSRPDVIFHLAAQPLVAVGLDMPWITFETNVGGTATLLDAARYIDTHKPQAIVVVTSDKVYRNDGGARAFVESDPLGGDDPYSASKACQEMVARAYRESYGMPIVTARAGNVIGGGDYAPGRLIPDTWRALKAGEPLKLRAPLSTRPWTYVEDVIEGYLLYAEAVAGGKWVQRSMNFGPPDHVAVTAMDMAKAFAWAAGRNLEISLSGTLYSEKGHLALDSGLAQRDLGWTSNTSIAEAITKTARWYMENDPL